MSAINVCLIYPKFLACLFGSLFLETILRQNFRKNPRIGFSCQRFFSYSQSMNAVKDISGALVHKSQIIQYCHFQCQKCSQLFTNEFVSNICVRNICLVVRRYNNNCFVFGKFRILTITHYKNQDTLYMIISIIIEMVTKGDLADGWWMVDDG